MLSFVLPDLAPGLLYMEFNLLDVEGGGGGK